MSEASYRRDQVVQIISSVLTKVEHTGDDHRVAILKELHELKRIIDEARQEIASSRPSDINNKHIPTATDELDAVVAATASATGAIMDACEVIENEAAVVGGVQGEAIGNEVTKIYEACSFQDITGQRIKKVVSTLHTIEQKVLMLMNILGEKLPGDEAGAEGASDGRTGDLALLNGPQMPDNAISQDDIDKLLSQFD